MLTKESVTKEFQKKPDRFWKVELFGEKGFERKKCPSCGKFFWTLEPERKTCADSTCIPYGFIGKTITKGKWDYVETWKLFEKFFKKNEHASVPRYPVIDRARPDLFFTIASIQDFQRLDNGNMVFVYPANPLIVPQISLRFGDISSVGVSGRHLTSFCMSGQHAFNYPKDGYFKDRCIELNFEFLNKWMGIPEKELVYTEDIWAMPDFSAFGPCMETFSKGNELVNSVFMQFQKSGVGFRDLDMKVIDVGWGHERLVWFSNGTPTMYDCVFGPVVGELVKRSGVRVDSKVFNEYSKLAGSMDMSSVSNAKQERERIAKAIGVSVQHLREVVEPMQAIYGIADHARTLLFAITDGGLPSNVGGGYNLRVVLRRALSFIKEHGFDFDLVEIGEKHAKFLKPMYPELVGGIDSMQKILDVEREKYSSTVENAKRIVSRMAEKKEKFNEPKLVQLYESHGISPEMVREIAGVDIPEDIYSKITGKHESKEVEEEDVKFDLKGLPATRQLYYDSRVLSFTAKVLKTFGNHVVLDRTAFYPEGGGQPSDTGEINGIEVKHVSSVGGVIIHELAKPLKGKAAKGKIDKERRLALMRHHTGIHIINGAATKVLGRHVWQAGSGKTTEKAHLDITHYKGISEEERDRIEQEANKMVKKGIAIDSRLSPRVAAEDKYGLRLYQGGAVPGREIRTVDIPGWDAEACAGTHCHNTKEVGRIVILGTERIQDGVDRITIAAGDVAENYLKASMETVKDVVKTMSGIPFIRFSPDFLKKLKPEEAFRQLRRSARVFSVSSEQVKQSIQKFCAEILSNDRELRKVRKKLSISEDAAKVREARNLEQASEHIFSTWKAQGKELEKLRTDLAKVESKDLLRKAKDNRLFDMVDAGRKELIAMANELLSLNPELTVILSNQAGEIVGMSKREDVSKLVKELCERAGGSGGGKPNFAQGKAELSKLLKVMDGFK